MLGNVRPGNESYIEFNDSIPKKTNYSADNLILTVGYI